MGNREGREDSIWPATGARQESRVRGQLFLAYEYGISGSRLPGRRKHPVQLHYHDGLENRLSKIRSSHCGATLRNRVHSVRIREDGHPYRRRTLLESTCCERVREYFW